MMKLKKGKWKFYISTIFITILFVALGYRSFEIQVLQNEKFSAGAKKQHSKIYKMPQVRGTLFDRNKKPLGHKRLGNFDLSESQESRKPRRTCAGNIGTTGSVA